MECHERRDISNDIVVVIEMFPYLIRVECCSLLDKKIVSSSIGYVF